MKNKLIDLHWYTPKQQIDQRILIKTKTNLIVLSVLIRIQCGIGLFWRIFFASFFFIWNVLCDGYTTITESYTKRTSMTHLQNLKIINAREKDETHHDRFLEMVIGEVKTLIDKTQKREDCNLYLI